MSIPNPKPDATDWTALDTRARIRHLELEGYVVFPPLLAAEQVAAIRAELDRLPTVGTDYSENQRGYSDVQWTDSPASIDLIAQPTIVDFLETLFGDQLICTSCVFALSRPGHPGIAIHTDAQPYGSKIFGLQSSAPRLVRVLWYLDDLSPERSPLLVIPRSHLSLHSDSNPYKRYAAHPEAKMICCPAGSAAIINQSIFHANYPNTSRLDRRLLAIAYRPAWAPPIAEVPERPAEKVAALPPHVRRLFGSLNTRNFDFEVPNRPANMANEAPGINPSRWSV
jgi:ectoine hydroxylase-related dioxygenase (phytanoyl-CoA dioxygenase family)